MPVIEMALMPGKLGKWQAVYGELTLTPLPTIQPIYDGARALLDLGIKPATMVHVRYEGRVVLCDTVGNLAAWTLERSAHARPRRVPYRPTVMAA